MNLGPPNSDTIKAFKLSGNPVRLTGGQGMCYRVGTAVLKPAEYAEEASWIANLNVNLVSSTFRVPKPIAADNGSWIINGWAANEFVGGKHKTKDYAEAIRISQEFHQALLKVEKPSFFETRNNIWAVADRMAWGELPFPDFALTNDFFQQISSLLTNIDLPSQLIHGDWGLGNILFDNDDKPIIIDFSPYWRPADFAIAIMIVDALAYEGADAKIIDFCSNINGFDQLLLRALARRICEYIGHQNHPENTEDRAKDIEIHLEIYNTLFKEK